MHQPRPYGLLSVGGELTEEDAAAVELLARRLTNMQQLSALDSLRMVRALPDGGYVIAQHMGGTFRVITHKPEPLPEPEFDGFAVDYIPMLFSGVVKKAVVEPDDGIQLKLSEGARKRIGNYVPAQKAPKEVTLQRFKIAYNNLVRELAPKIDTRLFYSQYHAQRPTWYSGAMAEVMQIVGGYGRQVLKDLPDNPIERARMKIPDGVMKQIKEQMGNVRLPGYKGLPDKEGKFQYDYKFTNTHGVAFGPDNKPWLLQISKSGVWAMPLPLIPATTTQAFRDYVTEKEDNELLSILDRFGGMPSGEGFPSSESAKGAWQRAGVVIKICETSDFYDHIAYSSACGWSFNTRGSEGFNTCYDYEESSGLGYGLSYKLKLTIGECEEDKLPAPQPPDNAEDQARLNAYMASLVRLLKNDPKGLAIRYKLRRVSVGEILSRASSTATQSDVDYWDNLEMDPIASHSGTVTQVGRGWIYHPAKFQYQPQIKFPEPLAEGCISHNFNAIKSEERTEATGNPKCDTIMFGYYIGDTLRVIKYFKDDRSYDEEDESDFEECMIVGSWTSTHRGTAVICGNFYTSDIDEREKTPASITTTTITGKDKGYDETPWFSFDNFFWRPGTIWRNRYFSRESKTTSTEGRYMQIGVCIPYFCRNAVIHARKDNTSGGSEGYSMSMSAIRDPTTYRYWTNDRIMAWFGGLPVMKGQPYPENGSPVWVEMEEYSPGPCSDFADGGPWIPNLPADYTWLVHPDNNVWNFSGGGSPPPFQSSSYSKVFDATETGSLKACLLEEPAVGTIFTNKVPYIMYFLASPDPVLGVFHVDACRAVFGDTVYANVQEKESLSAPTRKYFGYSSLADSLSAHHFIGVIHE